MYIMIVWVAVIIVAALVSLVRRDVSHGMFTSRLLSCCHKVGWGIHDTLLCLQQIGELEVHKALEIWFLAMLYMHSGPFMDDNVSSHLSCVAWRTWNGQVAPQHLALLSDTNLHTSLLDKCTIVGLSNFVNMVFL